MTAKNVSSNEGEEHPIGVILSGATTSEAVCQLLETAEQGDIREGMLVIVKAGGHDILARVSQIIPYNEFYTEGDVWSEARRKGLPIPIDVARRYEICKLELLMQIGSSQLEVRYPPYPGEEVYKIDPIKHLKKIFHVEYGAPSYVWFGTLSGYKDLPVPLNVENIPMHFAVFGVTGSGKSFSVGALIERLSSIPTDNKKQISYPIIIIDAHGDYIDYVEYVRAGRQLGDVGWVKRYVFPESYLADLGKRRKSSLTEPIGVNLDSISQRELAELIVMFYKGTLEGSELAVEGLGNLFEEMKDRGYNSRHDLILRHYKNLVAHLDELNEDIISRPTKKAIARALETFRTIEEKHKLLSTSSDLKENDFVDKITKEGGMVIIDFSADGAPGVDLKTKQFVMAYLATLLFEQFTNYKIRREDRYLLMIIEEAQNFIPDRSYPLGTSLAHSKLSAIATQGRKFGLSLCLVSQRPSFVDRIVLSMCNTFLIHRVSPEDVGFVKIVSGGLPSSLVTRLTNLPTGELIITGQMLPTPFPLLISVQEKHRIVQHTIGRTNVAKTLSDLRWKVER